MKPGQPQTLQIDRNDFLCVQKRHSSLVKTACFARTRHTILTADCGGTIRVWDPDKAEELRVLHQRDSMIVHAAYDQNDHRIVASVLNRSAVIWDVQLGVQVSQLAPGRHGVRMSSFSPDGHLVISALDKSAAQIWDAHTGQLVLELDHDGASLCTAEFSQTGDQVLTSQSDTTVMIADTASGLELARIGKHGRRLFWAAFSPDSSQIATASSHGNVSLFSTASQSKILEFAVPDADPLYVAFSPGGEKLAAGYTDQTARVWDIESGQLETVLGGHEAFVDCVAFSKDSRRLVTATASNVYVWDTHIAQGEDTSESASPAGTFPQDRSSNTIEADEQVTLAPTPLAKPPPYLLLLVHDKTDTHFARRISETLSGFSFEVQQISVDDELDREEARKRTESVGYTLVIWSRRSVESRAVMQIAAIAGGSRNLKQITIHSAIVPPPFDRPASTKKFEWSGKAIDFTDWDGKRPSPVFHLILELGGRTFSGKRSIG